MRAAIRFLFCLALIVYLGLGSSVVCLKGAVDPSNSDSAYVQKSSDDRLTGLGAHHAVTGATTNINGPFVITGTVGTAIPPRRLTTAGQVAQWWTDGKNPLAPGLVLSSSTGVITGTPSQAGNFTNTITAWQGTGPFGAWTTSTFTFVFTGAGPPSITNQPQTRIVLAGTNVAFNVSASGGGLLYQWFINNKAAPNATNSQLILSNVVPAESGTYFVVVSNSISATDSVVAQLLVVPPPGPTNAPRIETALSPQPFQLLLAAEPGYRYLIDSSPTMAPAQWQLYSNVPPALTNYVLSVGDVISSTGMRYYRARVTAP